MEKLINDKYGKKFQDHLIEQYKIYVSTAEKTSNRRDSANRYFLSINTILFTVSGYLSFKEQELWTVLISIVGILISIVWHSAIQSHKSLNSGKFAVIHELEKNLPAKLFSQEWRYLEEGKTNKYRKLTIIEKNVPYIFGLMYALVIVISVLQVLQ